MPFVPTIASLCNSSSRTTQACSSSGRWPAFWVSGHALPFLSSLRNGHSSARRNVPVSLNYPDPHDIA